MQVFGRSLHADGNAHRLQVHVHERRQVARAFMGDDGVDHGIFGRGLVQINGQVHFLAPDQLCDAERNSLRQRAIGPARVGAVQVARFNARQGLAGSGVRIDLRVGPLMHGIGDAGAKGERARPARS